MAGSPYSSRPASRLTLDWILAAVALIAIAVVVGSIIRVDGDVRDRAGPNAVGMRTLTEAEHLVAFEDYVFDAGGWTGRDVDDSDPSLGSVLGPVTGDVLSRLFELPAQTRGVLMAFDVIGVDGPVDVQMSINGSGADDVQTRERSNTRVRYWVTVDDPGPFVTLAIGADGGAAWALDNLSVTALLPALDD